MTLRNRPFLWDTKLLWKLHNIPPTFIFLLTVIWLSEKHWSSNRVLPQNLCCKLICKTADKRKCLEGHRNTENGVKTASEVGNSFHEKDFIFIILVCILLCGKISLIDREKSKQSSPFCIIGSKLLELRKSFCCRCWEDRW